MNRQLDRIERSVNQLCDRLDFDARIGSALARLSRETGTEDIGLKEERPREGYQCLTRPDHQPI